MAYSFVNILDQALEIIDQPNIGAYQPDTYYDPLDFLMRYQSIEQTRWFREMAGKSQRGQLGRINAYRIAFRCLCKAWLPEHGEYYQEMGDPINEWFLHSFYWHVVFGYLKVRRAFYCELCNRFYLDTRGRKLTVHHVTYELSTDGELVLIPGSEHLFINKTYRPEVPVLQVLCDDCHREVHGLHPIY